MNTREAAADYIAKGRAIVPLPARSKAPIRPRWQEGGFTPDDCDLAGNIGVLLGPLSGGLTDADLDHPLAVEFAREFLPATGATFGHGDRPESHRFYVCDPPGPTRRWKTPTGETIIELRGAGAQTMAPPSIHPSGEPVQWTLAGEPLAVPYAKLVEDCEALAAAVREALGEPSHGETPPAATIPSAPPADRQRLLRRAERYADSAKPSAEGGRNGQAFSVAGHLASITQDGDRLSEAEILDLLRTRWNQRNTPPLPDRELAAAVHSAMVNGQARPAKPATVQTGHLAPAASAQIANVMAPSMICLADVKPQPVRWLWSKRIARGKVTLFAGDPGLGKSILTLDLAARTSRGQAFPDCLDTPNPAGGVVLLSAEDDLADTIRPRLDAAGADVRRIHALTTVRLGTDPITGKPIFEPFNLAKHMAMLEDAIKQVPGCVLVIIDPVSAFLGGTDSHKNAEVRGLLAPLAELAARYGVAIICVTHLRKGEGPAMYRAMGSLAFIAAARAAYLVTKDQDDPSGRRRYWLPIKNNIGNDSTGLAYRLTEWNSGDQPIVEWEPEPVQIDADRALSADDHASKDDGPEVIEAKTWLSDALRDGPKPASEIIAQAGKDGIAKRTLDRAKKALAVKASKAAGKGGPWNWRLPTGENPAHEAQAEDCQATPTIGNLGDVGNLGNLYENPNKNNNNSRVPFEKGEDCQDF